MAETASAGTASNRRRELAYTLTGMLLGVLAPIGWIVLRLMLFWQGGTGLGEQIVGDMVSSPQQSALYLYMGIGTALVLGAFGYFIGRSTQQLHDRARELDLVNREMAAQKDASERRFRELDHSIKNFHTINADLQKSVNRQEVLRRAADGLHEVIGFDRVNVLILDPGSGQLQFAVSHDSRLGSSTVKTALPMDERAGCLFKAMRDREAILVEDVTKMPADHHLQPPFDEISQLRSRSFLICPIVVRDQSVGLIAVDKKHRRLALEDTDIDTVKLFADQVASSLARIHLLDAVEALTRQLEHTFAEFMKYREEHAGLIRSLRDTIASNNDATADISSGAGVIQESVAATRSSLGQISVSIDEVSHSLKTLNDFIESAIASMTEIHYTVNAVHESGVRSHAMSEMVNGRAQEGAAAVAQVIEGMQGIVRSVEQAETAIARLSDKSDEVGTITRVITDLTQKTSLLALNASIIAAQAGEHGRAFAVVADEVRALAQEAASSTDRINRIIEEIQAYTLETVSHIGETRQLVEDGRGRSEGMGKALEQILGSSVQAMEMAHEIRRATQEISRSVESVSRSVEQLGEMSARVTQASREESQGARGIVRAVDDVQAMSLDMVAATRRQVENSGLIVSSVEQVSVMVSRIFDEMEERRQASLAVVEDLRQIKRQ